MRGFWLLIAIFIAACAVGVVLLVLPGKSDAPNGQATTTPQQPQEGPIAGIPDLITVSMPQKGATISSPLTISGAARGYWYFEASFPIELRDASGKVIAQHYAEAQGEWMTEDFVIFKASLTYPAQPKGSQGTLILRKDNPSGLPENGRSLEVPVVF